jgi:hypothetical protein
LPAGIIGPLNTFDGGFAANVKPLVALAQKSAKAPGLLNKLRVWWKPPGAFLCINILL